MKILITWIGPWLDKGEAAMIISMVKALREKIPNVSITVSPSSFQPQEIDIVKYSEYDLKVLPGILSSFYSIIRNCSKRMIYTLIAREKKLWVRKGQLL
jgi:hypothetical protein